MTYFSLGGEIAECAHDPFMVELWYPREPDSAKTLLIGLCDVRAADDIYVSYDFERAGWSIKKRKTVEGEPEEVAFIANEE